MSIRSAFAARLRRRPALVVSAPAAAPARSPDPAHPNRVGAVGRAARAAAEALERRVLLAATLSNAGFEAPALGSSY